MVMYSMQHVPFEDAAAIASWAGERGHVMEAIQLFAGDAFPAPDDVDMLVVMGGPMNCYDTYTYPWLAAEKRFLSDCLTAGVPTFGVCLGAQLIACVLGAPVTKNAQPEIGWFPVRLTEEAKETALFSDFPETFTALHWHGDTFAIPDGAVRLAESDVCPNQAFLYGDTVLGLQFHLESTSAGVARLVDACRDELVDAPYVQGSDVLTADGAPFDAMHRLLFTLLDRFYP